MLRRAGVGYVGAAAGIAVLAFAVLGRPSLNGDVIHALIWGRDIAQGTSPAYSEGPTPHPLTNVVSGVLAVLGPSGAYHASEALALVFLGGLVVSLVSLGAALFSLPVGVLAGVLVATEFGTLWRAMAGFYDIPALALAAGALAAVARRRGLALPAGLLALAGLIRPEYWLCSGALGLYAILRRTGRERVAVVGLCAAAPALWIASDAVVTGDPLWSLTHTQDLAVAIGRRTGLAEAPDAYVDQLRALTSRVILVLGVVGAALAFAARRESALALLGVLAAGAVTYAIIGVADLSLIDRYLLPSAIALIVLASYAALGWIQDRTRVPRLVWAGAAALAVIGLLATIPTRVRDLRTVRDNNEHRVAIIDDLRQVAARLDGCSPLHAFYPRGIMRPTIAQSLDLTSGDVRTFDHEPGSGVFIAPSDEDVALAVRGSANEQVDVGAMPGRPFVTTRYWRVTTAAGCR